jgi:threonine/homoserine/homoserine lactone efflux protein
LHDRAGRAKTAPAMTFLILIKGLIVGLVIALPAGPVGVLCVRRCLFEGAAYGLVSGLGAATADASFAAIAGFGVTFLRDWLLNYQDWFGLAGGVFLILFGTKALLVHGRREPEPLAGERLLGAFATTFMLTIANPITILAFAAIFAKLGTASAAGLWEVSLLVAGVFLGSLLWWLGISFGIAAMRHRAGDIVLLWLNRVSGAILLSSGGGLLVLASRSLMRIPG